VKKTALIMIVALAVGIAAVPLSAFDRKDLTAIRNAVDNEAAKDVKWFKVLVTDARTKKETVKITLPVGLVEIFLRCSDDTKINLRRHGCRIDLRSIWNQLKDAAPLAIIEVEDEGQIVKVWLE